MCMQAFGLHVQLSGWGSDPYERLTFVVRLHHLSRRLLSIWDSVLSSYWFVPGIMLLVSAVLAFVMVRLDETVNPKWIIELAWFYKNQPDGARALLSTVAGSMITVAGVVFSIVIVALSLAASQYGPMVLRNFMRDRSNQIVLGTFVSTFLYCLLVLRTVQSSSDGGIEAFVPHLSVTVAVVLAIVGLVVLIYFIHHMAAAIQVDNLLVAISRDLERIIDAAVPEEPLFPAQTGRDVEEGTGGLPDGFEEHLESVKAARNGYLQRVHGDKLVELAKKHDLIIILKRRPGDFLVCGQELLRVWPLERLNQELRETLQENLVLGSARNQGQDLGFVLDQVVGVALRALSTGINDPYTAMMCIDRLETALCMLAQRELPSAHRYDDQGDLRLVGFSPNFDETVAATLAPIRRHTSSSVEVFLRLLNAVETIGRCSVTPRDRRTLLLEAQHIRERASRTLDAQDHEELDQAYRRALSTLGECSI